MDEKRRMLKRIFIAVIYLTVVAGLGIGWYFLFRSAPVAPAPSIPAALPIEVIWSRVMMAGPGLYSAVAKIKNPNTNFGASNFSYTFNNATGESFIWPGESKYLMLSNIKSAETPAASSLKINNPVWHEIKNFNGVNLTLGNMKYGKGEPNSGKFFIIDFTADNNTPYDLNKSYVSAIVFDKNKNPIAAASTLLENLKSKEHRPSSIPWFSPFPGVPDSVDLTITTNLWETPALIGQ